MKNMITFAPEVAEWILQAFGYYVGGEKAPNVLIKSGSGVRKRQVGQDYIFYNETDIPVPGLDGEPVHIDDFAGIVNTADGPRLVTKNICDLIELSDLLDKKCPHGDTDRNRCTRCGTGARVGPDPVMPTCLACQAGEHWFCRSGTCSCGVCAVHGRGA